MTEMRCHHCTAETSNGLALCDLCQMKASACLEWLPVYFRNLSRWRPGRAGSRSVPQSREPRAMHTEASDRVSRAMDEAGATVVGWAECLHDDRGVPMPEADGEADSITKACRMLAENLTSIATLSWCGDLVDELSHHERRLGKLTMDAAPGWYAGKCAQCSADTHVVPGITWVTCQTCGKTTYARDHLETVLAEAVDWVAKPMRIAETLVSLLDTEMSVSKLHKRVSKWGENHVHERKNKDGTPMPSIPPVRFMDADGDPIGPKRFRLGDVVDMLEKQGPTPLEDEKVAEGAA